MKRFQMIAAAMLLLCMMAAACGKETPAPSESTAKEAETAAKPSEASTAGSEAEPSVTESTQDIEAEKAAFLRELAGSWISESARPGFMALAEIREDGSTIDLRVVVDGIITDKTVTVDWKNFNRHTAPDGSFITNIVGSFEDSGDIEVHQEKSGLGVLMLIPSLKYDCQLVRSAETKEIPEKIVGTWKIWGLDDYMPKEFTIDANGSISYDDKSCQLVEYTGSEFNNNKSLYVSDDASVFIYDSENEDFLSFKLREMCVNISREQKP